MRCACLLLLVATIGRAAPNEARRERINAVLAELPSLAWGFGFSLTAEFGVPIVGLQHEDGIHTNATATRLRAELAAAEDPAKRLWLARCLIEQGRLVAASREARAVVEAIGDVTEEPAEQMLLAEGRLYLGEYGAAVELARKLHEADPGGPATLLLARAIAAALQAQGGPVRQDLGLDAAELLALMRQYHTAHPEDPEAWIWYALMRGFVGQIPGVDAEQLPAELKMEPMDLLWEACRRGPDRPQLIGTAIMMCVMLRLDRAGGEPDITEEDITARLSEEVRSRVAQARDWLRPLVNSADAQQAADASMVLSLLALVVEADRVEAMETARLGAIEAPGDHPLWLLYGASLAMQDKFGELFDLAAARAREEDSSFLRVVMGKALLKMDQPAEAEVEFDAAMELALDDPLPALGAAASKLILGGDEALAEAEELIDYAAQAAGDEAREPIREDLVVLRAALLALRGDLDGARRALDVPGADRSKPIRTMRIAIAG